MSYWGIPNAQVQAAVTQYMNTNHYNAANILGGGNYMGSGSGTYQSYPASGYPTTSTIATYPTHIITTGQTVYGQQGGQALTNPGHQHQSYPAIACPSPSGQIVSMAFTDMNGRAWSIDVDAAYVQILQAISFQHQHGAQCQPNRGAPSPPAIKMLEGDFSEDEMSQAEQIIQEMNCGSQEPCQCEA